MQNQYRASMEYTAKPTCTLYLYTFNTITNSIHYITGWPRNNGTVDTVDFSRGTLLKSTVIFFDLLERASISHYNNTKIIKFG